jgi:flagellar biosynthesis/type III secretory pathway protein FliH
MLAERVKEWTEGWKWQRIQEGFREGFKEGFREGLREGMGQIRAILRQDLEERFGPLNEEARRRLVPSQIS